MFTLVFISIDNPECFFGTHSCNANATCSETWGSHKCQCNTGYSGNGFQCNGTYSSM